ncbi:MAG: hypothetical protein JRN71_04940 [Nitrososphaerota archaeon]|jgi:2-iminobutanoate/2-iminopropanoate deaminase|nr:hypothetical protein [Nitrososphaerota archaeon]MDG6959829.1 hypothetical protein [Nitrososphaerota archaeon]MDG6961916.1 hypothetical protein [Nitrososphaerota archaeon]MDG6981238.1 hypothetical protein [Nitrososphaerota archaeon]MDG6987094.1 hypothetical protein [Nitrososphaerota archaeon]
MSERGGERIERLAAGRGGPEAMGPYSQAVAAGGFVFVSGQGPRDPATGSYVEGGIEEQTRQVLRNLESILGRMGLGLSDVVKANAYLRDIKDFEGFNRAYAGFFGGEYPARTTVQAVLPGPGALVELDVVAKTRE